jgi:hypothetical protein
MVNKSNLILLNRKKKNKKKISRLEPLVYRIKQKRTAILCPIIDAISSQALSYHSGLTHWIGVFSWSLHFSWSSVFPRVQNMRNSSTDPIPYLLLFLFCFILLWNG